MAKVNQWQKFKSLIGSDKRYRVTVTAVDTNLNRVKVRSGTSQSWVRGNAGLGQSVLIDGQQVLSVLPDLPYVAIEI